MRVIVFLTLGQSFVQKLKDVLELLFKYIFVSASKICTKGKGCLITRTKYTLTLLGTCNHALQMFLTTGVTFYSPTCFTF